MALFGKNKKEGEVKKPVKKVAEKKPKDDVLAPALPKKDKVKKGEIKVAPKVLDRPQITEKATFLMEKNQYIFQSFKDATKPEIKKAVEEVYGVDVEKIRIINVRRKRKRLGRTTGWSKGYKKAVVTIKKGQEIEIIPR